MIMNGLETTVFPAARLQRESYHLRRVNIRDYTLERQARWMIIHTEGGAGMVMAGRTDLPRLRGACGEDRKEAEGDLWTPRDRIKLNQSIAEDLAKGGRSGVPLRPL